MSENNGSNNGMRKIPQAHGGALNAGGTRGNRGGGDTPDAYKALCRKLVTSPKARASVAAILEDHRHPHFAAIYKHLTDHGYGKPVQAISGPNGSTLAFSMNLGAAVLTPNVDEL